MLTNAQFRFGSDKQTIKIRDNIRTAKVWMDECKPYFDAATARKEKCVTSISTIRVFCVEETGGRTSSRYIQAFAYQNNGQIVFHHSLCLSLAKMEESTERITDANQLNDPWNEYHESCGTIEL